MSATAPSGPIVVPNSFTVGSCGVVTVRGLGLRTCSVAGRGGAARDGVKMSAERIGSGAVTWTADPAWTGTAVDPSPTDAGARGTESVVIGRSGTIRSATPVASNAAAARYKRRTALT